MALADDIREVRDLTLRTREMVVENRVEIGHLKSTDTALLTRIDHEAEITHNFRDKVQDQLSQDVGKSVYEEKQATRILRVVTVIGGTVGLLSTILIIIRTFT